MRQAWSRGARPAIGPARLSAPAQDRDQGCGVPHPPRTGGARSGSHGLDRRMVLRVRWILLAATLVAALAPTATAGAALRGRVVHVKAFGVPTARPSARNGGARTFRVRSRRRAHSRGVDDEHVAP